MCCWVVVMAARKALGVETVAVERASLHCPHTCELRQDLLQTACNCQNSMQVNLRCTRGLKFPSIPHICKLLSPGIRTARNWRQNSMEVHLLRCTPRLKAPCMAVVMAVDWETVRSTQPQVETVETMVVIHIRSLMCTGSHRNRLRIRIDSGCLSC